MPAAAAAAARAARARAAAKGMPAVELHLHLDGSLPASFVRERAEARGLVRYDELRDADAHVVGSHEAPSAARDWLHGIKSGQAAHAARGANWQVFDVCNKMLQQRDELRRATIAVAEAFWDEHRGKHLELRFCPQLHTLEGLGADEVLQTVCQALSTVRGLTGGIIVCGLRSHTPAEVRQAAALACAMRQEGVIGFDIAGDEASFPLHPHVEAIRLCQREGLMVTVHAGETGLASDMDKMHLALALGVDRIGHGWALARDTALLRRAVDQGVVLECCLTANIRPTRVRTYASHPVRHLLKAGARVTLNSDNLMLSGTARTLVAAPERERLAAADHLGFGVQDLVRVSVNAAKAARGISPQDRAALIGDLLRPLVSRE